MDLRILSDDELLALACEINRELLKRVPAKAETPAADTPAPFVGRCPHCGGIGYRIDNGEFCTCSMGRDVQRVERSAMSRFAPADAKYAGPEPEWAQEDDPEESQE